MQETDQLRQAIVILRKYLGKENTIGLEEIIHSEWEDGEESAAADNEGSDERERLRRAADVGFGALERRAPAWTSSQVCMITLKAQDLVLTALQVKRLKCALRIIQRVMPGRRKACIRSGLLDMVDDGIDFTPEERKAVENIIVQQIAMNQRKVHELERFRGRDYPEMRRGTTKKGIVYKECISEAWASLSPKHQAIRDSAPSIPIYWTILDATIPDLFMMPTDLEMVARSR